MSRTLSRNQLVVLISVDTLMLLIVTWVGFMSHNRGLADGRWLTTFIPLVFSWFIAAPWLGLFQEGVADRLLEFWRPMIAALLAAPLAVLLRALWLQQTVIPVFGLVMIAMTAASMTVWRLAWAGWSTRKQWVNGRS
ncbi:MAG TPA: DUF3054 domain-containing protein [Bellilinea sp.]|nr:DUF3054 domain-containing protein [Bellilinea sp.]